MSLLHPIETYTGMGMTNSAGTEASVAEIPRGGKQIPRESCRDGRNTCGIPADTNYET